MVRKILYMLCENKKIYTIFRKTEDGTRQLQKAVSDKINSITCKIFHLEYIFNMRQLERNTFSKIPKFQPRTILCE